MQVPEWLEEPLLHLVHHATTTLDGLIEKALAKYGGRYVVGEELAATDDGKERPCVIRTITSAKRPEGTSSLQLLLCQKQLPFQLCVSCCMLSVQHTLPGSLRARQSCLPLPCADY